MASKLKKRKKERKNKFGQYPYVIHGWTRADPGIQLKEMVEGLLL
jgi:hypothetical protein